MTGTLCCRSWHPHLNAVSLLPCLYLYLTQSDEFCGDWTVLVVLLVQSKEMEFHIVWQFHTHILHCSYQEGCLCFTALIRNPLRSRARGSCGFVKASVMVAIRGNVNDCLICCIKTYVQGHTSTLHLFCAKTQTQQSTNSGEVYNVVSSRWLKLRLMVCFTVDGVEGRVCW